ncbi:hypothetical protein HK102_001957 [Quaeritorhiza haematococci]|nr:hypothetical protein HK102_001957 [Quaeritorhiza haematococci]
MTASSNDLSSITVKQDVERTVKTPTASRPIWRGNFTFYLLIGAIFSLWFVFGKGIPYFWTQYLTVTSGIHLVAAMASTLGCLWNLFHTPSHGPSYRKAHIWVGRIVLLSNIILFVPGCIVAFRDAASYTPLGISIGITVGGVMQLFSQTVGYYYIRKKPRTEENVKTHKFSMIMVYFAGCLIPAFMRIPNMVGWNNAPGWWLAIAITVPMGFGYLHRRAIDAKRVV